MGVAGRVVPYPLNRRLLIPTSVGRGAAGAVATAMSCRASAVAAHHLAWCVARTTGSHLIPGKRQALDLPVAVRGVLDVVADVVGGLDAFALLSRRQDHRGAHLILAFRDGSPITFCKIAGESSAVSFGVEQRCLTELSNAKRAPVIVPRLLVGGTAHGLQFTAMSALPPRPHRPFWGNVAPILEWLQLSLADVLPRVGPAHWVPMHGDFAPWNLRRLWFGSHTLFDYEDARYGPPSGDAVFWMVATATLKGQPLSHAIDEESREFWREFLTHRLSSQTDPELDDRLLATLLGAPVRR